MKTLFVALAATFTLLSAAANAQQTTAALPPYACPALHKASKEDRDRVRSDVTNALNAAFDAAMGPDAHRLHEPKVFARVAAQRIDERRMAELANVSGCAALLDQHSSCSAYFDTEMGNPLSAITSMKRGAPLRKQFEGAIARLPVAEMRLAAQTCFKQTASHE